MRRLALDTNVLIGFLGCPERFEERFSCFDEISISSVVLGEFRAGLFETKCGRMSRKALDLYLRNPAVKVAPITDGTAAFYAKVFQELRAKGCPIPTNDMWIAASALEVGATLATEDRHFSNVPMLQLV